MLKTSKRLLVACILLIVFAYNDGIQYVLTRLSSATGNPYFNVQQYAHLPNCNGEAHCTSGTIKVVSYNILCRQCNDPGSESWQQRISPTGELLRRYDADLIGLQEPIAKQDVQTLLKLAGSEGEYAYTSYAIGDWEYPDSALLYRKSRFDLLDSGQIWLSPKPTVPLSKAWKAFSIPRYVNWAYLQEKNSAFRFLFINTHFDANGANKEAAALLFAETFGAFDRDIPMIVTGDFNISRDSRRFANLQGKRGAEVIFTAVEDLSEVTDRVSGTAPHALSVQPVTQAAIDQQIDHILVAGPVVAEVNRWVIDRTSYGEQQLYTSDHPLIFAELSLTLKTSGAAEEGGRNGP